MKVKLKKITRAVPAVHVTDIAIVTEFIKLDSFLKFSMAAETGGDAKFMIQSGDVSVNGEVCTMRGKKLYPGDTVAVYGETYRVTSEEI